jgi:hypothetical protein
MKTRNQLTALFSTVIKENPKKSKAAQREIFENLVCSPGYEDYHDAAMALVSGLLHKYVFDALHPPSRAELDAKAKQRREEDRENRENREERSEVEIVKRLFTGRMLDLVTPNGKALGDCTGAECYEIGGFYTEISEKVGDDELVRNKLTEADVQDIVRAALLPDELEVG